MMNYLRFIMLYVLFDVDGVVKRNNRLRELGEARTIGRQRRAEAIKALKDERYQQKLCKAEYGYHQWDDFSCRNCGVREDEVLSRTDLYNFIIPPILALIGLVMVLVFFG